MTGKESSSNRLIVAFDQSNEPTLWSQSFGLEKMQFLDHKLKELTKFNLLAKARYRDPSTPVTLEFLESENWKVTFEEPQRALTPGQVLALYQGERLVASGIYSLAPLGRASLST